MDKPTITFIDEDARILHHPYNDVIVITLTIANYTTRRVLVDNGSSIDTLYYLAFQQMKLIKICFDQLLSFNWFWRNEGFTSRHRFFVGYGWCLSLVDYQRSELSSHRLLILV